MKIKTLFIAAAIAAGAPSFAAETTKPNIIFILADDMGWSDLGCYGAAFHKTPRLDRMASEGMKFTDAYAACGVCSPTRAALMTGKYPARLHLTDWLPGLAGKPDQKLTPPDFQRFLPLEEVTVAEALKAGGYKTALIGKWHLGQSADYYPEHQGFDLNIAGCYQGHPHSYFSPYEIPNLPDGPPGEYLNDRLTDEALKFIERARGAPFFLYLPHYAVHAPLQVRDGAIEKYKGTSKNPCLQPLLFRIYQTKIVTAK